MEDSLNKETIAYILICLLIIIVFGIILIEISFRLRCRRYDEMKTEKKKKK